MSRTALSRANRTREVALAGAWREAAEHLAAALEVCREIEAEDSNGDTALAKTIRGHVTVELAKVEDRLGELPRSRPPEPGQGEHVDELMVERIREAKTQPQPQEA